MKKVIQIKPVADESFYKVVHSKLVESTEISVSLFEHCNLKCDFCFQDHGSSIGMQEAEILEKVSLLVAKITQRGFRDVSFKILGGELFQDELLSAGYLSHYQTFVQQLREQLNGIKASFHFVTNLVFDQRDKVMEFVERNDLLMYASYDSTGRFNQRTLETFKSNLEFFKSRIDSVSMILTNRNIRKFPTDEYAQYLVDNFTVYWDYFIPSRAETAYLTPTQSEILEHFRYLLDHHPKCQAVAHFWPGKSNTTKLNCARGNNLTLMADNAFPEGCDGAYLNFDPDVRQKTSSLLLAEYFEENQCFTCEFYSRCSFTCFINNENKRYTKDVPGCIFKELFKHAETQA